ncbi:MAG TPA: (d)CMP kinase [Flavobacteriales bacterium]|nr:(d)CMP kinase [Flavobacteriales bacterium]
MKRINIAIDGYSGCGKSTLAKNLASDLGYVFIDTGAMYRGITHYCLTKGVDISNQTAISKIIEDGPNLIFESKSNNLLLNGDDIEKEIRNNRSIASSVSQVASVPSVREYLKQLQLKYIVDKGVVMEGRDIGTVIMPDAELKIFITATLDERVSRRLKQLKGQGEEVSEGYVRTNLIERDRADASRDAAPLRKAKDAIAIDTTTFSKKEQLEVVKALLRPITNAQEFLPFIQ